MKKDKVFRLLDEIAEKRSWLGPLYPVKLHQMGEPMLHPDLVEIVAHAEKPRGPRGAQHQLRPHHRGEDRGPLPRGLTNLILSYQTPDTDSFKTRKAPGARLRRVPRQGAAGRGEEGRPRARTHLEIDIMNTKYSDGYRIVSADEQALAFLEDWIAFAQALEVKHGLAPTRTTRGPAPSTSSTRTRTAAATSSSPASTSSGSAATPGATSSRPRAASSSRPPRAPWPPAPARRETPTARLPTTSS